MNQSPNPIPSSGNGGSPNGNRPIELPCARCGSPTPAPADGVSTVVFSDGERVEAICATCSDTWNSRRPHMRDASTFLGELKADRNEFPNRKDMEMARREAERSASQGLPFGPGDTVRRIRDAEGRIDLGDTVTVAECRLWIQRLDGPPYGCKRTLVRTTDGRDLFGDFVVVAKSAAAQVEPAFDTDINLGDRVRVLELYGWAAHERANGPRVGEIHTVARSLGGYPVPGRSGFVEIDCGRPVGLDKDKLRRDCFVARFELVERAGQAVKASAPAYDEDIRVGDLVEVVSIDEEAMRKAFSAWVVDVRVGRVVHTEPSFLGNATFCAIESQETSGPRRANAIHGRFRILERHGLPYYRPLLDARIPASHEAGYAGYRRVTAEQGAARSSTADECSCLRAPDGSSVVCPSCAPRVERFVSGSREEPVSAPEPDTTCHWCSAAIEDGAPFVATSHAKDLAHLECGRYLLALDERLKAGGAHDCPEERESVRRWVDAKREAERRRCECGAEPDQRSFSGECADCQGMACRLLDAQKPSDPANTWTAWSTATSEGP